MTFDLATLARACYNASITGPTGAADHICANAGCQLGSSYSATLAVEDGRPGTWSILGWTLASGPVSGELTESSRLPEAAVGDYPIVIQFVDNAPADRHDHVASGSQPSSGIGGGTSGEPEVRVGAADLDLHVSDSERRREIYPRPPGIPASGRRCLNDDANAACRRSPAGDLTRGRRKSPARRTRLSGSCVARVKVGATRPSASRLAT